MIRERVLFDANEEQRGVGKGIGIYQLIQEGNPIRVLEDLSTLLLELGRVLARSFA